MSGNINDSGQQKGIEELLYCQIAWVKRKVPLSNPELEGVKVGWPAGWEGKTTRRRRPSSRSKEKRGVKERKRKERKGRKEED